MVSKILLWMSVLTMVQSSSCFCQSTESPSFMAPFDSIEVEYHKKQINMGANYLLLIKAPLGSVTEKGYYLISTGWYELQSERSFNNVDSLLNGHISEMESKNLIALYESQINSLNNKSICDLSKMTFTNKGFYKAPRYYQSSALILAALVSKGVQIDISDYEGEPSLGAKFLNCFSSSP